MNHDFVSGVADQTIQECAKLVDNDQLPQGPHWEHLLSQSAAAAKAALEVIGFKKLPPALEEKWRKTPTSIVPGLRRMFERLEKPAVEMKDLRLLPAGSFAVQIRFKLQAALLTKDEAGFYPTENGVRKDRALQRPFLASTSWKGCFGAALYRKGFPKRTGAALRLLGNDREAEENKSQAGRLHFYSTLFEQRSFHVLNPHSRKTKAGKLPIYLESVPRGSMGWFTLLYVPFGPDAEDVGLVGEDLVMTVEALYEVFRLYGFGAKVSSGFGTAQEKVESGVLRIGSTEKRVTTFTQLVEAAKDVAAQIAGQL